MLDVELLAQAVKDVLTSRCPIAVSILLFAREAVSKLAAIVGQQLDDFDWTGILYLAQKVDAAGVRLIGIDFYEDPAGRAVNGNEQVPPCVLVGHLRQVFDIDMRKCTQNVTGLEEGPATKWYIITRIQTVTEGRSCDDNL